MTERRGVVGQPGSSGRRLLLLPDGVTATVPDSATDDEITAEFSLDRLVHTPRLDLSPSGAVCVDGPAAGLRLDYVVNELGDVVADFDGPPYYEVIEIGDAQHPAQLRHLPGTAVTADRIKGYYRLRTLGRGQ
ncbi:MULTISPECIES: hypothetical protein [Actinoplanes]|uniref:hypothetical protein n=1 Tax=Actinoplanes TaxID=1865 RepID=UPI0005F2E9E0|nr:MULTISPECIES: hypothetical protein [Actinoplanes]GLY05886.1 hypothetical protein Acsp01_62650 [Actinoplanes sp. NBRC 101535]